MNTVKPVSSGYPRDPSSVQCPLNTGCPLKTGSLRIRLKMVILIFLSIKKDLKGPNTILVNVYDYFHKHWQVYVIIDCFIRRCKA